MDTVFMYSIGVEWVSVIYVKRNMILSKHGISAYITKYISSYVFSVFLYCYQVK